MAVDQVDAVAETVQHLMEARLSRTLAQSIAGICKSLQLNIVAEGVERAGQRDILRALGYPVAQGNVFSRPLAPEDLAQWVRERSR